jgi:hypothetical protein
MTSDTPLTDHDEAVERVKLAALRREIEICLKDAAAGTRPKRSERRFARREG